VTTLHENILVYGRNYDEHFENLTPFLDRCKENGTILKPTFGQTFYSNGVTADPQKIQNIKDGGRPRNTEDVRSLLMACQ